MICPPYSCDDVYTEEDKFGLPAKGIDLRDGTDGQFEWVGCVADGEGCDPDTFFCDDTGPEIKFGSSAGPLRAITDWLNFYQDADPGENPTEMASPENPNGKLYGIHGAFFYCTALGYGHEGEETEYMNDEVIRPQAHYHPILGWLKKYDPSPDQPVPVKIHCKNPREPLFGSS